MRVLSLAADGHQSYVAKEPVLTPFPHVPLAVKNLKLPISSFEHLKLDEHTHKSGSKRSYSDGPYSIYTNETHPILQSSGLQHWFKNWQHLRQKKLTASTFSLAVGMWPRGRVRLWLEKLGAIESFAGNLATCWSNIKEEEALERYKLITNNAVTYPEFQVHRWQDPNNSWLAASPDGAIDFSFYYNMPMQGVLEVKCPFFGGNMERALPWKRVPLHYVPQAQGLMEILNRDWMDMYVWTVNGSSLFRIYRDEEYWRVLKIALCDFWLKHVLPAKEIYERKVITNPLVELKQYKPAPRHELIREIVHGSKLVVDKSELLIREIHGRLQY